ncbi:hypothetical protein G9A89_020073 [Geosiphon pyriformis]|nr:hypothetical protein G9A89_020073 [Geosiphon pyriformis]
MKKIVKDSGSGDSFKPVLSRKKRKGVTLEKGIGSIEVSTKTGNTTESKSINMKKECLVEKTSFDYGKRDTVINKDHDYTPKEPRVKTAKALDKSLGKINFSGHNNNDNVFLDTPLELPSSLKNLVTVSVRKSFTLDIGLDKVVEKSSQEKLMVVRKLFSKVNSFGEVSTPSKFLGIIRAFFTSESNLAQAIEKMRAVDILVNNNLKKSTDHSDWAVVIKEISVGISAKAVRAALSKFGIIKSIKMLLVRLWQKAMIEFEQSDHADLVVAEWSILIGKDAVCVVKADLNKKTWDARDYYRALLYILPMGTNAQVKCAVVCFNSAESLDFSLVSARCTKYKKSGYTSLDCAKSRKISSDSLLHKVLSDANKSRLVTIYTKNSAPVAHFISFGVVSVNVGSSSEMKPFLLVVTEINNRFAALEHSLTSLTEHVDMLAKRLETLEPMISQLSPRCQPLVTPLSQNQEADIVMSKGSDIAISSKTVAEAVVFDSSVIRKMENTLKNLAITVIGLSAKIDNASLQEDIVYWHIESGNMIINRFDGVKIFFSGLDKGFLGAEVAIILNNFLTRHVVKIEEVLGHLISIRLLFKSKLSSSVINSFIVKAVNSSIFTVLSGDFNENKSKKSANFKFCSELDLVNAFSNLRGAMKVIDYIFVSGCLLLAMVGHKIISVSDFFDTDYNAVVMSIDLGGFLDANRNCWKFKIKDADEAKWLHYKNCSSARLLGVKNRFSATIAINNLDSMWSVLERMMSSKFLGLELLVVKIVKRLSLANIIGFNNLVKKWSTLDANKALVVTSIIQAGKKQMVILKHLSLVKREYRKSKMYKSKLVEEVSIRNVIKKCMEKFCLDKDSIIRSVLDCPFHKVVLDHLVKDDKLVLKPEKIKLSVDKIMESWTRKHLVFPVLSDLWAHQYTLLDYVRDNTFSGVICAINMSKLVLVIGNLPDGKATSLSGIPNELWKHGSKEILRCLLVLLNTCLTVALIKTARKILSKILSDHILLAYIRKAYNSVGWHHLKASLWHIKMCSRFIEFFGNIHENRFNRVITDFGLLDNYRVHRIFYDLFLCKIKQHKQLCKYRIDTKFVSRTARIKNGGGMTSYFVASAFVDNTIWVGNCQASTQYALNIASEFFVINNISINSEKTVAISINQGVKTASLSICGQPISIAKKGEAYHYLGIFLFIEKLFKPSVARTHSNVHFFTNVLLRKAVTDKQFSYLDLAGLKSKACLLHNFPSETLHHPSLYGLKSFEQASLDPLQFPVRLCISPMNNFLAGVVRIFLDNKLFLANKLPSAFHDSGVFPISLVLKKSLFFDSVCSLKHFGKRLDLRCPVPYWFVLTSKFLNDKGSSESVLVGSFLSLSSLCISNYKKFLDIRSGLHEVWFGNFEVYTDGSLKNAGSTEVIYRAAAYFLVLDMGGLLSSTMAELQAVALALEYVPFSCDDKDLTVCWIKIKGHFGVIGNVKADTLASKAAGSLVFLPVGMQEQFLMAESLAVSGNTYHFIWGVFRSICRACWEAGSGCNIIAEVSVSDVNWVTISKIWYSNSHMLVEFTSQKSTILCMYIIKAVYHRLSVTVHKKLYNKKYSGMLCLLCDEIELPDYVLDLCHSDIGLYSVICKGFVLKDWYKEAIKVFDGKKRAVDFVIDLVEKLVKLHHFKV